MQIKTVVVSVSVLTTTITTVTTSITPCIATSNAQLEVVQRVYFRKVRGTSGEHFKFVVTTKGHLDDFVCYFIAAS